MGGEVNMIGMHIIKLYKEEKPSIIWRIQREIYDFQSRTGAVPECLFLSHNLHVELVDYCKSYFGELRRNGCYTPPKYYLTARSMVMGLPTFLVEDDDIIKCSI